MIRHEPLRSCTYEAHKRYRGLAELGGEVVVRRHGAGAKLRELVALSGVSAHTVSNHLRARGVNTRRGLAPEDIAAAAQLYRAGRSLARVAEKFDTTPNTVRARLLEVDVRVRDTNGRER